MSDQKAGEQEAEKGGPPPQYSGPETEQPGPKSANTGLSDTRSPWLRRICNIARRSGSRLSSQPSPQPKKQPIPAQVFSVTPPPAGPPPTRWSGHSGMHATHKIPSPSLSGQPGLKYSIRSLHCPQNYHSQAAWTSSTWLVELQFSFDAERELLGQVPWRDNLDCCEKDKISVVEHPFLRDQTYRRILRLGLVRDEKDRKAWDITIRVWSRDSRWLAGLSRTEVAAMISLDTAIQILGWTFTADPLAWGKLLYVKPLKEWHHEFNHSGKCYSFQAEAKLLEGVNDEGLRQAIDDHFRRHISA